MDLSVRMTKKQLSEFVDFINELSTYQIGALVFHVFAREVA